MPFIAPECLLGVAKDGAPADVWSAGIVLMEMMFGLKALSKALSWDTAPTSTEDFGTQLVRYFSDSAEGVTSVRVELGITNAFQRGEELLAFMLQVDPQNRPTMESLQTFIF
mmetsp:Transcript_115382/g.203658  ORF Transcript_115382/g.203658 Transcript_115382/m.203658 type:complete len:112 (-) Transcript_115382:107-442(-)